MHVAFNIPFSGTVFQAREGEKKWLTELLHAGVEARVPEEHGSRVAAVGQVDTVGVVVDGGGGGGGGGGLGAEEVSGVVGSRHAAPRHGLTLEQGDHIRELSSKV